MNKKLNIYFFGDTGAYDELNPAYVCNKEYTKEILYLIAKSNPYEINNKNIIESLNLDEETVDDIIFCLKSIDAIEEKKDGYKVNFTVFLEEDAKELDSYFSKAGKSLAHKVKYMKADIDKLLKKLTNYKYYSRERLLYHIICDCIFDGLAFDFFTDRKLFDSSKNQPGNRDYIIFGYEDSEVIDKNSNGILCSSNNFRSSSYTFNSFGDSNGTRKDFYRLFRSIFLCLQNATPHSQLNLAYISLMEEFNAELAEECGNLMLKISHEEISVDSLNNKEKKLLILLKELNYINYECENRIVNCNVPIFSEDDNMIIEEIASIILNNIVEDVRSVFNKFYIEKKEITPIKHGVNIQEISIELWHQIFGYINEHLVEYEVVEKPKAIEGEGRYLRSLRLK